MAPLFEGLTSFGMEFSAHALPKSMIREVQTIFPGVDVSKLLVVPTCQHAKIDLVNYGDHVENEKDQLLEQFMDWAQQVCSNLQDKGHWADYIDPCSGLPMIHQETNHVYPEVPAIAQLLGYKTANAGCCKVLLHPRWGSSVYPASLFTDAPAQELQAAIRELQADQRT